MYEKGKKERETLRVREEKEGRMNHGDETGGVGIEMGWTERKRVQEGERENEIWGGIKKDGELGDGERM